MDNVTDRELLLTYDWDPVYLLSIFDSEFNDTSDLWDNIMSDSEILDTVNIMEKYNPIVEDISMEDEVLCAAVEPIKAE